MSVVGKPSPAQQRRPGRQYPNIVFVGILNTGTVSSPAEDLAWWAIFNVIPTLKDKG
jgi:hypothetical protein